jgi:acyl-homoserine lactone acylase PvdQ
VLTSTQAWRTAVNVARSRLAPPGFFGSNAWLVAPSKTPSGHAMVRNDPHLSLSAPSVLCVVKWNAPDASGEPTNATTATGVECPRPSRGYSSSSASSRRELVSRGRD